MADEGGIELGRHLGLVLERVVVDVSIAAQLANVELVQGGGAVRRVARTGGRLHEAAVRGERADEAA